MSHSFKQTENVMSHYNVRVLVERHTSFLQKENKKDKRNVALLLIILFFVEKFIFIYF